MQDARKLVLECYGDAYCQRGDGFVAIRMANTGLPLATMPSESEAWERAAEDLPKWPENAEVPLCPTFGTMLPGAAIAERNGWKVDDTLINGEGWRGKIVGIHYPLVSIVGEDGTRRSMIFGHHWRRLRSKLPPIEVVKQLVEDYYKITQSNFVGVCRHTNGWVVESGTSFDRFEAGRTQEEAWRHAFETIHENLREYQKELAITLGEDVPVELRKLQEELKTLRAYKEQAEAKKERGYLEIESLRIANETLAERADTLQVELEKADDFIEKVGVLVDEYRKTVEADQATAQANLADALKNWPRPTQASP